MPNRQYPHTLDHEQGQVALSQTESTYLTLRSIRTTLRRWMLTQHAESIRRNTQPVPTWHDCLVQALYELAEMTYESPEADLDNPLPPDYDPHG